MFLPRMFRPLTELKGFVLWKWDPTYQIYYFFYKLPFKRTDDLRIFIYVFQQEDFGGVECTALTTLTHSEKNALISKYQQLLHHTLEKRKRLKKLFQ